ncbi:endonuclease/exonuclease/phosphatase family protein [Streptomyces acidiscabies]|uniref:Endonuclease/exonuclease/phosphatase family protein n=1 Tax=Streptomyces acidiscabies TaxID=42234 RepID=A0AAP6BK56_9ACTN|nr:endonuclease/exonuclease/phosphatase family protein [Streptomyces acidiscabies]MBP5936754.1 endonuclease/exonuclease/phosphatase family protein [Streptomyces sp. LBUM 1476]MBZ3915239.1 endonuclease/exonuclease/phosphatase family protein [Streptomyces acidiscabies]MDX2966070.1 endonuclease/exonuclease/phosphatase family protein [Streptomyces acidiscabies]MDX3021301.1 endonuclease/exonuclease/phosphatase family protein [Streptomyces acidiscabies]MDX3793446.1 endonuclease/exonuclease/phosphata
MKLRAVTWNLYLGGLDGDDEQRFDDQVGILTHLHPDILALQECTSWDEKDRATRVADKLGMKIALMAPSYGADPAFRNFTATLYRPDTFRLIDSRRRAVTAFHHALILTRLRPQDAPEDGSGDLTVLTTHLDWSGGEARLAEARRMTDYAGEFPGTPGRGLLMGDLNCPHPGDRIDWNLIPRNLRSRYCRINPDGTFGDADLDAYHLLLAAGWQDPETLTGRPRAASVGHFYDNEPVPMRFDHILVSNLRVHACTTYDTAIARRASDHLPVILDAETTTP